VGGAVEGLGILRDVPSPPRDWSGNGKIFKFCVKMKCFGAFFLYFV